ncbi:MAG: hypothetical protein WCY72_09705 [Lysobacteraceae bacterium]
MSTTPPPQRPRAWRLLRIALIGVALSLVSANVLLNTALLEPLLNRKPEKFTLEWQRGLMLWPGHITLWDVDMRGQARRNAWRIQAEKVSGRIALWPLLRKELRFTAIHGQAPRIAVQRMDNDIAPMPPRDNALRLVFQNVEVDSPLHFSFNQLEISGHAKARASWRHQLRGGEFALESSTLQLDGASARRGERELLRELQLEAQAQISPHRRREHPGLAMLALLQLDAHLDGATPGIDLAVDDSFDVNSELYPGLGTLAAHVRLDHGQIGNESELLLRTPIRAVTHAGNHADDDALLRLDAGDGRLRMQLDLPPVADLLQRARARLRLDSNQLPLPPWEPHWDRLEGEVDLHARFSSLALVQPLLTKLRGFTLDGRGDVEGRILLAEGQLAAGTEVTVHEADFKLQAYSHLFHGAARARARFTPGEDGQPQAHAEVRLDRFDLSPASDGAQVLGSGRDLLLELVTSGNLMQMRDRLDARLQFSDVRLPDLSRFNRYLPRDGVQLLSGSGRIGADMRMQVARDRNGGRLRLAASGAALRLGDMVLRSDLDIDAQLEAGSLEDRHFSLPGTRISLRRAAIVEPADERVENWWASADIRDGQVTLGEPLDLTASAQVDMLNIAPLLSMFAQRKRFPRWIRRTIDAGQTKVSAQVEMRGQRVTLDHVFASNERFDVQARLRLGEQSPDGQLYARWGLLGMGLQLAHGEREFHLAGAKKWFDEQAAYLPKPRSPLHTP